MTRHNGLRRFAVLVGLTCLPLLSVPVSAQQIPGIQVDKISTNPTNLGKTDLTSVLDNPTFFTDALKSAWHANRPKIDQQIQTVIGANQAKYGKVTLYQQSSNLSDNPDINVQVVGSSLVMTLTLRANVLTLKSTTPTILGKWADPKLSLTYDLSVKVVASIPSLTAPLTVTSATATLANASIDSQNLPADVLDVLSSVIKFFGGPDFKALAEHAIDGSVNVKSYVDQALAPVNRMLQGLAGQGYTKLGTLVNTKSQRLNLQASPPGVNVSAVVTKVVDNVNVASQYRSLITTYVRVKMLDGTYVDDNTSPTKFLDHNFSRGMLSDVPGVPIRIEVYRYIDPKYKVAGKPGLDGNVILGAGGAETVKIAAALATVKVGLIRAVDLTYNVKTHTFSGAVNGSGGVAAVIPHGGPDAPEVDFALGDDLKALRHMKTYPGFLNPTATNPIH